MPRKKQIERPKRRTPGTGKVITRPDRFQLRYEITDTYGRTQTVYESLPRPEYSLEQAHTYLDARIAARNNGTLVYRDRHLMGDYLTSWATTHARRALTERNRVGYVKNHLNPYIGHLDILEITEAQIRQLWRDLLAKYSRTYVQNIRATFLAAIRDGKAEGVIDRTIAAMIADTRLPLPITEDLDTTSRDRSIPTTTEVQTVIAQMTDPLYQLGVMLGVYLGMRVSEILGLPWSNLVEADGMFTGLWVRQDLVFYRGHILNGTKTELSGRWLPLYGDLIHELHQRRAQQAHDRLRAGGTWLEERSKIDIRPKHSKVISADLVFTTTTGAPLYQSTINRHLAKACDLAGVPRFSMHTLRHVTNSMLIEFGVPDRVCELILGHTNARTNRIYSHAEQADLLRRMAPIEARLKQG